jgi:NAD(P)-dependent dehydrogenase (short-subunit alcohol dehydrogenase family)
MSANWLQGLHNQADEPGQPQAMPVFEGQKLVVVGGSSGMGRDTAADVVAAGGSAVIIGPSHPAPGPPPTATRTRQTQATTPHGGHHDGPAGKAAGSWGVGAAG